MLRIIISKSNRICGYALDDIFINSYLIKYLISDSIVDINNKAKSFTMRKENLRVFGVDTYQEVLVRLASLGFHLNDIIFVPCKYEDINVEDVSTLFNIARDLKIRRISLYMCVDTSIFKPVAYLMLNRNMFFYNDLHIFIIECIKKSEGYGTKVIKQLKNLQKVLDGLSVVTAINFWKSVGAVIEDNNHFTI